MTARKLKALTRADIRAGDTIQFKGGQRTSAVSGLVLKASPANLKVETTYMGSPMVIKIRRSSLDGAGRVRRGVTVYEVAA